MGCQGPRTGRAAGRVLRNGYVGHPRPLGIVAALYLSCGLRDQYAPSPQVAGVEILYGVVDGVQRVGRGVQVDLALGGEHHQFDEVVVGADQVARDVALGRDDVYSRDLHHAAVADNVVGAARSGHVPGVVLGATFAHIIEDDFGAVAVGHLEDGVDVAVFDLHRLVGS